LVDVYLDGAAWCLGALESPGLYLEVFGILELGERQTVPVVRPNEVRGSRSAKRGGNQKAQLFGCPSRLLGWTKPLRHWIELRDQALHNQL
jgi:hypothetical protein